MPGINPYGANDHGVETKPLDYSHEHSPSTKNYLGFSMYVDGNLVGRIKTFNLANQFNRKVTGVFELSNVTFGKPIDAVPAGSDGLYTATMDRAEVWDKELEKAIGFDAQWETLQDQDRPFTIQEVLFKGKKISEMWLITGCWFTGKNFSSKEAEGDGITTVSGEVSYVRRRRVM